MVNFALPLAALAITASVAAAPAASPAEVSVRTSNSSTFSFEQWVEDIIANPDTALSVDEAVAAAQAADVVGSAGGLKKKAICDQGIVNWKRAPGRDAAVCIDYLARKGQSGVNCGVGQGVYWLEMCRYGGAQITGSKGDYYAHSANCNDIARTAGKVFDSCWRADDTIVGSELCLTNIQLQVNVLGL